MQFTLSFITLRKDWRSKLTPYDSKVTHFFFILYALFASKTVNPTYWPVKWRYSWVKQPANWPLFSFLLKIIKLWRHSHSLVLAIVSAGRPAASLRHHWSKCFLTEVSFLFGFTKQRQNFIFYLKGNTFVQPHYSSMGVRGLSGCFSQAFSGWTGGPLLSPSSYKNPTQTGHIRIPVSLVGRPDSVSAFSFAFNASTIYSVFRSLLTQVIPIPGGRSAFLW